MVHVRIAGRARCAAAVAREVASAPAAAAARVLVAGRAAAARGELGEWTDSSSSDDERTLVVLDQQPSPRDSWGLLVAGADDVVVWDDASPTVIASRLARWAQVDAVVNGPSVRRTLIGSSPALRQALRELVEAAIFGSGHVLLIGETGTGKELAARLVHDLSVGRARPSPGVDRSTAGHAVHATDNAARQPCGAGDFVVVDCTTIVPSLSGSELFGHEKGAFTGADRAREGAVAQAHGGTLFLDEIGDLAIGLQAELLRTVQEGVYKRVGGSVWARSDFRVVSATHRDLGTAVGNGDFRADLYHRLATTVVRLPPLRERRADIVELFGRFYCAASASESTPPVLDLAVVDLLIHRDYPGNLRELRQLATRVAARHAGPGPITPGMAGAVADEVGLGRAQVQGQPGQQTGPRRQRTDQRAGLVTEGPEPRSAFGIGGSQACRSSSIPNQLGSATSTTRGPLRPGPQPEAHVGRHPGYRFRVHRDPRGDLAAHGSHELLDVGSGEPEGRCDHGEFAVGQMGGVLGEQPDRQHGESTGFHECLDLQQHALGRVDRPDPRRAHPTQGLEQLDVGGTPPRPRLGGEPAVLVNGGDHRGQPIMLCHRQFESGLGQQLVAPEIGAHGCQGSGSAAHRSQRPRPLGQCRPQLAQGPPGDRVSMGLSCSALATRSSSSACGVLTRASAGRCAGRWPTTNDSCGARSPTTRVCRAPRDHAPGQPVLPPAVVHQGRAGRATPTYGSRVWRPARALIDAWLERVLMLAVTAVAAFGVVSTGPETPSTYAAAWGSSIAPGTFTATSRECRADCTYFGPFRSEDGRVVIARVQMNEPFLELRRDEQLPAVWVPGSPARVYLADASRTWIAFTVWLAGCLAVLSWTVVTVFRLGRHDRQG